ncbi:MAG: PEP-CTERM sorting domain-containing protein [Verrucomicrobiota bacterium]
MPEPTFDEYRIELGGVNFDRAVGFADEVQSPLFSTALLAEGGNAAEVNAGNEVGAKTTGAEWDYLWRNASRIPITSIPEPTTASLLIGGGMLLWARRTRKPTQ